MKVKPLRIVIVVAIIIISYVLVQLTMGFVMSWIIELNTEVYANDEWQTIDYFGIGTILVPNEWEYVDNYDQKIFYSDSGIILYMYKEYGTLPEEYPPVDECDRYILSGSGAGTFKLTPMMFMYTSDDVNYYYGTLAKDKMTSIPKYGAIVANCDSIDKETFMNIMNSYKK